MPFWPSILVLVLLLTDALTLLLWLAVSFRVSKAARERTALRDGLAAAPPAEGWPTVSIIVPVHNEERVIETCVGALRGQRYEKLEIIFVLDRCTDRTREMLRAHAEADQRTRLIENDFCPPGWAGKCHAAFLGAQQAKGEYLLFTDADTRFDPALVGAAVAAALQRGAGLLSLLSTLSVRRPFERIAQPVATLNLVRMYPLDRVNRTSGRSRPFANGQFLLFEKGEYERIGGHQAVRDALLEDIALAHRLFKSGGRCALLLADRMLTVSMYDSLEEFRRGWKRIYIEACHRKPNRLRQNGWRLMVMGIAIPCAQIASLASGAVLLMHGQFPMTGLLLTLLPLLGWTAQLVALGRGYALGGAPWSAAFCYPIGAWVMGRIFFDAAKDLKERRPVRWGGKEYVMTPR